MAATRRSNSAPTPFTARRTARQPPAPSSAPPFDLHAFLDSAGLSRAIVKCRKSAVIFSQGDLADQVMYIQQGTIKFSVMSKAGKEVIVAMLGPGDFFGEGCLAGQPRRMASATAMTAATILVIEKAQMVATLREQPALSERFILHMLSRNIRIEEDLVDQLFNGSEKRLARILLLMARYGNDDQPIRVVHDLSQETLAEMVGTTRSRVNYFMNKFRDLGFIEYNGGLKVNSSLLSVVLHD
jgi:CRP-like cAMP-binding protein